MEIASLTLSQKHRLYSATLMLAFLSILFAFAEAIFSTWYGYNDESLTLFGFGIGSFIEIISAIGVAHMIIRIRQNEKSNRDNFERTALQITGSGFYVLVAGIVVTCAYNTWTGHTPGTTLPGVIISICSIFLMLLLVSGKTKAGKKLQSDAILADAECTKVCIYTSLVLLMASGVYELTHFKYVDDIGSLGIAYFSFKEARECFEKARSEKHCSCG